MTLLDGARERATRSDGTEVALLRNLSVSRELASRVDSFPLPSDAWAVVVYDPDSDAIESVHSPLGFSQATQMYQDLR